MRKKPEDISLKFFLMSFLRNFKKKKKQQTLIDFFENQNQKKIKGLKVDMCWSILEHTETVYRKSERREGAENADENNRNESRKEVGSQEAQ